MLHSINPLYLQQMLRLARVPYESLGQLYLISGHEAYNNLLRVNAVFSTNPCWWPVDRTQSIRSPLRLTVYRHWQPPIKKLTLADSLAQRVQELCASGNMCNILWSGGIDSTTMLTAFLLFAPDLTQVRMLYSPWSTYEHPDYVKWLQVQHPLLEILDISGTTYLDHQFDGLIITGEGGDESMASLDQTFYSATGHDTLHQPWQDYFHRKLGASGNNLIEFFQAYCSLAGRPIQTLLEARWWFYVACKTDSLLREAKIELLLSKTTPIDPSRLIGFFDCDQFLSFIYHNLEQIIADQGYANWKKCFKKICVDHDGFQDWYQNKIKFNSHQLARYYRKKTILTNRRWLAVTDSGDIMSTPHLPFLNRHDLDIHWPDWPRSMFQDLGNDNV